VECGRRPEHPFPTPILRGMSDLELRAGGAVLNVDTLGGGMRALRVGDWEILDGYRAGEPHTGRRGHILAPWPSRIFRGRYRWAGVDHELPITDARHESATHGLVDKTEWTVDARDRESAELSVRVPRVTGYPFDVRMSVRYRLRDDGLDVVLKADNLGAEPAPFGVGMHPYFRCGAEADDTRLTLPVQWRLVLDHNGRPTGETQTFDGALGTIGDRELDLVLRCADTPPEAIAEISGPSGALRLDLGPSFRWLVVFTGDSLPQVERRRAVAVEPLTCPPNAFATSTDVLTLHPDRPWSDRWSLSWSPR
jgi:aldose 1-epimerase